MAHTQRREAHEHKRGVASPRLVKMLGADARLAENDEPEPMECGDLTPEEIDAAYHLKKVGGGLRRRDDRDAAQADLAWLDVLRRSEAI